MGIGSVGPKNRVGMKDEIGVGSMYFLSYKIDGFVFVSRR